MGNCTEHTHNFQAIGFSYYKMHSKKLRGKIKLIEDDTKLFYTLVCSLCGESRELCINKMADEEK